jgi:hypothetical protein
VQLYRYFVSQSGEFCRHNTLCYFSTSVYCCKRIFCYRFSPETFGYTLVFSLSRRFRSEETGLTVPEAPYRMIFLDTDEFAGGEVLWTTLERETDLSAVSYGATPGVKLPSWDLSPPPYIIRSPLAHVGFLFQRSISHYFVPYLFFIGPSPVTASL